MAGSELASIAMAKARRRLTGIRERHAATCPAASEPEVRCICEPSYEAAVWARRDGRKIRKSFASAGEARRWRTALQKLSDDGGLRAPPSLTLEEAAEAWLERAGRGAIQTRSGDP